MTTRYNFSPKVGDLLKIKVETSQIIEKLNLVICGRSGTLHRSFFQTTGYEHEFRLTQDMDPSFDVVVYYINTLGILIYDSLTIKVANQLKNKVS